MTLEELVPTWPSIDAYLDRILDDGAVDARWVRSEGLVHAAIASNSSDAYAVIQREAAISFSSSQTKVAICHPMREGLIGAVRAAGRTEPWWPTVRDRGADPRLGEEADFLAVDELGRLLVIEAKPAEALAGIAWGPAQVRFYAELFARWLEMTVDAADVLNAMLDQRVELGLASPARSLVSPVEVVPVLAIGAGTISPQAYSRLSAVAEVLDQVSAHPFVRPLEVWTLDQEGRPTSTSLPINEPVAPKPRRFALEARAAATSWKATSPSLPEAAREPGRYRGSGPAYSFCLPLEARDLNLLPDAREAALERFASAGIPWHHGGARPSNHLLSSQVQCANALAPFVSSPGALARMLGTVLDIADVLPFGAETASPFDRTDHVVFEWIGLANHLNEWRGESGTRGANNTSADAAVRYRTPAGQTELALIEWKYTEQYLGHELSGGETSKAVRAARYVDLLADEDSPIRTDLVGLDDLLVEPFYQLMRLQLLAWRMETAHELDVDRVRVVYMAPSANGELARSFNRPSLRALAGPSGSVFDAWRALLRRPDRFVFLDTAALVTPDAPPSAEFRARYGHIGRAEEAASALRPDLMSVATARMILQRVAGDGGVLEQIEQVEARGALPTRQPLVDELRRRVDELGRLARHLRADVLGPLLHDERS
jgi:hypothetical protein